MPPSAGNGQIFRQLTEIGKTACPLSCWGRSPPCADWARVARIVRARLNAQGMSHEEGKRGLRRDRYGRGAQCGRRGGSGPRRRGAVSRYVRQRAGCGCQANWLDATRRCTSAAKPDWWDTGCIGRFYRTLDQKTTVFDTSCAGCRRRKGKRIRMVGGMAPLIRILSWPARMISGYTQWASAVTGGCRGPGITLRRRSRACCSRPPNEERSYRVSGWWQTMHFQCVIRSGADCCTLPMLTSRQPCCRNFNWLAAKGRTLKVASLRDEWS